LIFSVKQAVDCGVILLSTPVIDLAWRPIVRRIALIVATLVASVTARASDSALLHEALQKLALDGRFSGGRDPRCQRGSLCPGPGALG